MIPTASISVDEPNQLVGGVAKLYAYASFINIAKSPYYLKIYDVTTNTLLTQCDADDCTANVSQNVATTHTYRAYIAKYNTSFPPSGVQGFTDDVSVTWGSKLVLNTSHTGLFNGEKATLTAKAAGPGAIRIKDLTTGQTVGICSSPAATGVHRDGDGLLFLAHVCCSTVRAALQLQQRQRLLAAGSRINAPQ